MACISSRQALKTRRRKEVICGKEPKWDLSRGWQPPGGVEPPRKCAVLGASGFAAAGVPQHTVWEPPSLDSPGGSAPLSLGFPCRVGAGACGASQVAVWEDAAQTRQ